MSIVISQETIDGCNAIFTDLNEKCISLKEQSLIERICNDNYDNYTDNCKIVWVSSIVLKIRGTKCKTGTVSYLQSLSDCYSCGFNVSELILKPSNKIWTLGVVAYPPFYNCGGKNHA